MTGNSRGLAGNLMYVLRHPSEFGNFLRFYRSKVSNELAWRRNRDDPAKIVQEGYDQMAKDYGEWTTLYERADRDVYTEKFLGLVKPGSSVLELGCGPGEPTTRTLAEHYNVTANDISESCLNLARKAAPSATFVHGDVTKLNFDEDSFDGICAYYVFHHIPRERYAPLLANIASWLKPGGTFMAAMYPYDVDNLVNDTWHDSTMYWSSFDRETTEKLIRDAGFDIEDAQLESAVEDGRETTFLWVTARRQ